MMANVCNLIANWRSCDLTKPPYIFSGDESLFANHKNRHEGYAFDKFITSDAYGADNDRKSHLGLLPMPYVGNLETASIFILMLNPGFAPCDYYAEEHDQDYREMLIRNLRQEFREDDYPFFFLNPKFSWHSGAVYWHKKFKSILEAIKFESGDSYQVASERLSKKVACLELFPYHSKAFGAGNQLNKLASVSAMKSFVSFKAAEPSIKIIVTRHVKEWDLIKQDNIILYDTDEARSASLSKDSKGGKAILKILYPDS